MVCPVFFEKNLKNFCRGSAARSALGKAAFKTAFHSAAVLSCQLNEIFVGFAELGIFAVRNIYTPVRMNGKGKPGAAGAVGTGENT